MNPPFQPRQGYALADAGPRVLQDKSFRSTTVERCPGSPLNWLQVAIGCHNDLQNEGCQGRCGGAVGQLR